MQHLRQLVVHSGDLVIVYKAARQFNEPYYYGSVRLPAALSMNIAGQQPVNDRGIGWACISSTDAVQSPLRRCHCDTYACTPSAVITPKYTFISDRPCRKRQLTHACALRLCVCVFSHMNHCSHWPLNDSKCNTLACLFERVVRALTPLSAHSALRKLMLALNE